MICPNPKCKALLKPGVRFCASCGAEVADGGASPTEVPKSVTPATVMAPKEETAQTVSGAMLCMDRLSVLFEGCPCIVRFRVDRDQFCADAQNLRFIFENQLNGYKCSPRLFGHRDGMQEFSVTFPEQKAGAYVWYVTAEYESGGRTSAFEGEIHLVVERQSEARKVADKLSLNITTTINTGNACDVYSNQSAADALDKIVKSPDDPFKAMRRLIDGRERAWAKVDMYEVERVQPPQQAPAQLTLTCGDEVLQLVSDNCVTFGRNRDNLIPLRVCGADGHVDAVANDGNISRFHFSIERAGCDCVLRDGSGNVPSTYGTRVDGVQLLPLGTKKLAIGRTVEIEAGRSGVALKMRAVFHRDSLGQAAGFVLDRLDGACQRVCAVWSEVPLEDGTSISWDGRCWTLRTRFSGQVPLCVGSKVSIGGRSFDVQPFHQTHLN